MSESLALGGDGGSFQLPKKKKEKQKEKMTFKERRFFGFLSLGGKTRDLPRKNEKREGDHEGKMNACVYDTIVTPERERKKNNLITVLQ